MAKLRQYQLTTLNIYKWCWLIGLTIFFFSSYNFANWFTATRSEIPSLVFDWEKAIPLWAWTIVPYWSIDLMYGLAILLAKSQSTVKTLCLRLLSAQIICVSCFLVFPLKFSFERPELEGYFGLLFDILMGFDKPFNQAPSLHITLLIILWQFYSRFFNSFGRYILHIWCLLIALSVLTTWQHHFFDIPTGLWVGCFCIWLWPDQGLSPLVNRSLNKHYRWIVIYFSLSIVSFSLAIYYKGWVLWLLWLAGAWLLVAMNYLFIGAKGFQKQANGRFQLTTILLYWPYFIVMWINSRLWTFKHPSADKIVDNVYLGRIPDSQTLAKNHYFAVVDLCAELPLGQFNGNYTLIPVLDMTPLSENECQQAAKIIEYYSQQGKVLVCCGLGYSRSATAIIAWLLWTKRANDLENAIAKVQANRKSIVISAKQQLILSHWFYQITNGKMLC